MLRYWIGLLGCGRRYPMTRVKCIGGLLRVIHSGLLVGQWKMGDLDWWQKNSMVLWISIHRRWVCCIYRRRKSLLGTPNPSTIRTVPTIVLTVREMGKEVGRPGAWILMGAGTRWRTRKNLLCPIPYAVKAITLTWLLDVCLAVRVTNQHPTS